MKRKNLLPRILYPARLSLRFDGEIKSFPDKQKLREFSTTKSIFETILKELLKAQNTRRKRPTQNKSQTVKKMVITYSCSVAKSRLSLCDPTDCRTPSFPILPHLPEFVKNSCPLSQ